MEQYTAVTPKKDMQIQGKSDKEDEKEHWRNAHEFKLLYYLRTKYKGNFELISSKKSTPKLCNDGIKAK